MSNIKDISYALQDYRDEGLGDSALPELLYCVEVDDPEGEGCEAWRIGEGTDALLYRRKAILDR